MRIRRALAEDAKQLVALHYDAIHEGAQDEYAPNVLDSWSPRPDERRVSWMRERINAAGNEVLVAEAQSGSVIGFCMFAAEDGFVHAVYVAPAAFGRGIGRDLLRRAEDAIARTGVSQAKLNASKNALEFYLSAGYAVARPTTQSLSDGTRMDCYEMHKDLSAGR